MSSRADKQGIAFSVFVAPDAKYFLLLVDESWMILTRKHLELVYHDIGDALDAKIGDE